MRLAKTFYWRVIFSLFFLQMINIKITKVQQFILEFLEFQKYTFDTDYYILFCFLTDSVFYVLCAYFDESMSSIGGYEP